MYVIDCSSTQSALEPAKLSPVTEQERVYLPSMMTKILHISCYNGKGDPMECGSYRGMKLLEHAMKVVEKIFEHRIQWNR